ncbi:MAG: class I SAM-dependent methyltransferase [Bacteroidales bacterium]|nr:class I SAM-dependent methyltransferase [Bacteroidales bacterium]MCF8454706.1 class I SAM-dependent methyltransferase [Bacteroidales bacterium]
MKLDLPPKDLLSKTGKVDYYDWNYKFPIKYIQQYRFKRILPHLAGKHYVSLLEIGTGSGVFIPELSKYCDTLTTCDIHSYVDPINKICEHFNISHCSYSTQSIEKTNFGSNSFDAIVAVSVLEFVDDLDAAVDEIKRILKPDGVFITICPMESKLLDSVVSMYSKKKAKEEFGESRKHVSKFLESNFTIFEKGYLLPIIGKWFPVYIDYVLGFKDAKYA